jgi:flagellar M-ring protein FliF
MNNDLNFQAPDENPENIGFDGLGSPDGTDPGDDNIDYAETEAGGPADASAGLGANREPETQEPTERHRFIMPERLTPSGIWRAFRDYWTGLARRTKLIWASSAAALLLFTVIMTVVLNQSPWVIAYSGLEEGEMGEIAAILEVSGISYDVNTLLKTVSVRERDRARVVGTLALQGYPKSGIIYEEETSGGFMETQEEKRLREKRNRERWLAANLDAIPGVNFSSVTLTIPDNSRNVLVSERIPSSAAVMLWLRPGFNFSPDQIRGLENMIQKSVAGLLSENITINDGTGVQLNADITEESSEQKFATIAELRDDFERRREREIRNDVINFLAPAFGPEGISVQVSVTMDFDDLITEAKRFTGTNIDPDTDQQSGIAERQARDFIFWSQDPDNHGYSPGVLNPDEPGYYEFIGDPSEGVYREEYHHTEELLVNYILTQTQRRAPEITNISLGVWVDADELDPDLEEYFYNIMATSTGISDIVRRNRTEDMDYDELLRQYITIAAIRFPGQAAPPLPFVPPGMRMFSMLLALGAIVIVLIIIVICVIAAMSRRTREREAFEEMLAASPAGMGMAPGTETLDPSVASLGLAIGKRAAAMSDDDDDISVIEAKEKTLKRQIKLFTEQNPEIAAQLIRTLIKGDEAGGG